MSLSVTEKARQIWPRGLTIFVDFAAASHARAVAFLVALSLVALLPGFFQIPPVDRDEARFAQATKQMVESGDYVDIRFQNEFRYKKPVGIYWLQAAVVKTADAVGFDEARRSIWIYRIPSLIGAVGAVLLTYWTALAFVSRRCAILAATMLATSILLGVEARLAKTDAMLLLACIATMGAMARIYLGYGGGASDIRRRWLLPGIFWTALAGGVLLKGPLILMFAAFAAAALVIVDRSARWLRDLRPIVGILWLIVLVLPWFAAILSRSGSAFLSGSVGEDMLSKVVSSQESHGAPPGYFIVLFFLTFWPASLLAGLAAPAIWRDRREPKTKFLLAWLVPSWLAFELVITKLPHYVLPLYPAIAILIAARLRPFDLSRQIWLERGSLWWFVAPIVIGIAAIAGAIALAGEPAFAAWPFIAAAVVFGFRAWWLYDADGAERSLLRASAASVFLAIAIYGIVFPSLSRVFPSAAAAEVIRASDCQHPLAAAAGYHEPSLVFLLGTETQLTDGPGAADFLNRGVCRFALIEARHERSFAQRAEATGLRYARVWHVDGINISGGRQMSLTLFRSDGRP
jgi:4-amino-4-deoxy-L-arabinose transferase-like glycosyltransferase